MRKPQISNSSMEIEIIHETEYAYKSEVFFEPHYFRFKPNDTPYASLKEFRIQVFPKPMGISEQTDAENNTVHFSWFEGMHLKLSVKVISVLTIKPYNAFNFLLYPSSHNQLPFSYSEDLKNLLEPCLEKIDLSDSLRKYGEDIMSKANHNTLTFLSELTIRIHKDFILEIREVGEPYLPDETFALKRGSCRDFAWMQIQLLRHLGMAARFASGYFYIEAEDPKFELHGWTEVFLPGAGWIGFDPSNGIRTTNMYFLVSSSANYLNTMPVSGSVRGDAPSILTTSLEIKMLS